MAVMERIRLRALEPEDLEWLYRVENDETIWKWGNTNVPYSRYALKKYIAESSHDIYADGQLRLAAVMSDGRVVGCADLVNCIPGRCCICISFMPWSPHGTSARAARSKRQISGFRPCCRTGCVKGGGNMPLLRCSAVGCEPGRGAFTGLCRGL